jgi:hypothetical protein
VELGLLGATPVLVGGDAELGDVLAVADDAHLGIAGQPAGQQDAVHGAPPWPCITQGT